MSTSVRPLVVTALTVSAAAIVLGCSSGGGAGCGSACLTHPAGVIDSTFPLAGRPFGVAINSAGVVLVGRQDANDVVRGSLSDFRFPLGIPAGNDPGTMAMSPDGATAIVSNYNDNAVGKIDVGASAQTTTRPVGSNPFQVKFRPDGTKLYASTADSGVIVFDAATLTRTKQIMAGSWLNGMTFAPSGHTLVVTSNLLGTATVIDADADSVLREIVLSSYPQEVAISPDGNDLWVADEVAGVQVYDFHTGDYIATVSGTSGAWGLAMTPDGEQLYATLPSAGQIMIISRSGRSVLHTLTAGRPRRIAFDATGAHAVVADEALGAILIR